MIVRVIGEAQYKVHDELLGRLNDVDTETAAAVERGDEEGLRKGLEQLAELIRNDGERLADEELIGSDLMMPPTDLTLEEARELFSGEGLIPDLPGLEEPSVTA